LFTAEDILENTCILVANVRRVLHFGAPYVNIRIVTQINTSAQNVGSVVRAVVFWQYTDEVIQDRNHLHVLFVANDLRDQITLVVTAEFTVEKNRTNAICVTRHFVTPEV